MVLNRLESTVKLVVFFGSGLLWHMLEAAMAWYQVPKVPRCAVDDCLCTTETAAPCRVPAAAIYDVPACRADERLVSVATCCVMWHADEPVQTV